MAHDNAWMAELDSELSEPVAPACPACGEALLILGGPVRCPRCGLTLCESCAGETYSD